MNLQFKMNILKNPLVIVANGEFPTHPIPLNILDQSPSILACDGAADTLINNNFIPDIIIGDLDSISETNKNKYSDRIIFQKDQSQNDLRKAINYAINKDINDVSIIGATGKREDHMIGNIFIIQDYKESDIKVYTNSGVFRCIHQSQIIDSFKGQKVSMFSTDPTIKISSNNLKYNFNSNPLSTIYYGTLNECIDDFFEIKISHGNLLIYQTYK